MIRQVFLLLIMCLSLISCQSIHQPTEDYILARAAIDAARSVQAARYSPGYWHQAEEAYRQARIYFKDQDYESAQTEFVKARLAAEKAENSARLIRQKTGDVL